MPNEPGTEFWRDLKPITNALKPDAQPEVFHQIAPIDDECYYAPLSPTVGSRPLWISPRDNRWADVLWARSAGLVNRHYHPHEVFAYTISGNWGYLEQPWTATAGSFVYETPDLTIESVPATPVMGSGRRSVLTRSPPRSARSCR